MEQQNQQQQLEDAEFGPVVDNPQHLLASEVLRE